MVVIPAIDIKDGECVRLFKGDYSTVHKVAQSPLEAAKMFEAAGATYLHIVDLDGAKDGKRVNSDVILSIVRQTSLIVEVGGGIRDMNAVEFYLDNGFQRVILGSAAVKDREFVKTAVSKYGNKIVVGIDAKEGMVCAEGWTDKSQIEYIELAKKMEEMGVSTIIFTDIDRDGTLAGPNLNQLDELSHAVSCNIIASGGVSSLKDIINLAELNVFGVISGKAIYTGELDLKQAIDICSKV